MQSGLEDWFDYVEQGRRDDWAAHQRELEERYAPSWSNQREASGTTPDAALWDAWDWEIDLGGILAQADRPGDGGRPE